MAERLRELGILVRRQRTAQGIGSQAELAKRARIGPRKVSDVERGIAVGPKTYDAIERALQWPHDSIQRYLGSGLVPESTADPEADEPLKPVLTDAEIIAMDRIGVRKHYFFLEKEYGEEEADDWLLHAAQVRRDARRAAREPLAADGA